MSGYEITATAVITGAGGGLGYAAARRISEKGLFTICADIDVGAAEETAKAIAEGGGAARALKVDVTDAQGVDESVKRLLREGLRIEVLMNFAGVALVAPFAELSHSDWQRAIDINLTGTFNCGKACCEHMIANGYGRIINVTSIAGMRAGYGRCSYGSTKAAVIGLTQGMAVDLAPYGITVNAIAPGPVDTALVRGAHNASTRDTYLRQIPMRRFGVADEVAIAAVFLASSDASYITGHVLTVDGGYMAAGILDNPHWRDGMAL